MMRAIWNSQSRNDEGSETGSWLPQPTVLGRCHGSAVMNGPLPRAPRQGLQESSVGCRWLEALRKPDRYTIARLITLLVGTVESNGLIIWRTMPTTPGPLLTRGGLRPPSKTSCCSLLIAGTAALPSSLHPPPLPPPHVKKTTHNRYGRCLLCLSPHDKNSLWSASAIERRVSRESHE